MMTSGSSSVVEWSRSGDEICVFVLYCPLAGERDVYRRHLLHDEMGLCIILNKVSHLALKTAHFYSHFDLPRVLVTV